MQSLESTHSCRTLSLCNQKNHILYFGDIERLQLFHCRWLFIYMPHADDNYWCTFLYHVYGTWTNLSGTMQMCERSLQQTANSHMTIDDNTCIRHQFHGVIPWIFSPLKIRILIGYQINPISRWSICWYLADIHGPGYFPRFVTFVSRKRMYLDLAYYLKYYFDSLFELCVPWTCSITISNIK